HFIFCSDARYDVIKSEKNTSSDDLYNEHIEEMSEEEFDCKKNSNHPLSSTGNLKENRLKEQGTNRVSEQSLVNTNKVRPTQALKSPRYHFFKFEDALRISFR